MGRLSLSYISPAGLITLSQRDKYSFKVTNVSLTENYVLNPLWDFVTKLFPLWLAPNLVTFIGFFFMICLHFLVWFCYPDLSNHANYPLYCVISALFMFIYQTMDGCDGKQARRTKSSSPLGECVDHGCDAWCLTTLTYCITLFTGCTAPNNPYVEYLHVALWCAFFASHWEHRYTDVFYLGYVTAGDGLFLVILKCLLNAAGFYYIWSLPVPYTELILDKPLLVREGYVAAFTIISSVAALRCFFIVKAAIEEKKGSMLNAILDWVPLIFFMSFAIIWIRSDRSLFNAYYMWFLTLFSFVFPTITSTMDVARVTRDEIPWFCPQYVVSMGSMLFGAVNANKQFVDPKTYLFFATILNLAHYLFFVSKMMGTFCKVLNIEAFRIKHQ